ncbi:bifunctional diguanylate cyclase/phosphodiesterase [Psychrobacillus sp. OK032]|uniref:sensor domain-containing protein n=1 Tax=Psychrobacillus sp. OK032 TaxID=1884358 RepID=UPI0008B45480|nr:sensor domain-containing diguanylate cyclase [Psychrobacillus sp. OK032]SES09820.1 PAS domain S-box-containing protein/diguanylate cyclase (GGDEF) domain-containing protein [Psychrobacillus sp. OK032]
MSYPIITKEQFHLLYDLTDEYVFFMRQEENTFVYEYINKKAEEVFTENPRGKRLEQCFNDFHCKTILYYYNRAHTLKQAVSYQDHHCVKGATFVNETSVIPIIDEDNVYILATTKEVIKTKELQESTYILESYRKGVNDAALVAMTNEDGMIVMVNELFETTSKFRKEELIGKSFWMINSNYHEERFFEQMWETIRKGDIWRGQIRNRTKYGSFYWVDATIIPITNYTGKIEKYLTIQFDNTEKKRIMTELRNIERSFKLITEHSNDLIAITDEEGYLLYSSPSHEAILNYEKEELLGTYYLQLIAKESTYLIENMEMSLNQEKNNKIRTELLLKTKDGSTIWTDTTITTVQSTVDDQEEKWFVFVSREITEKRALEEQLKFLAFHDSLTGLPNRRMFYENMLEAIRLASEKNTNIGLLYIDGDNFKEVNDQFGHDMGDRFLKHFAEKLEQSIQQQYKIYRFGGDEFIIVIEQINDYMDGKSVMLESIIQSIQDTFKIGWMIDAIHFTPTISIGVSIFPHDGSTINELLENADLALYEAKKLGKNNFVYTSAVHT